MNEGLLFKRMMSWSEMSKYDIIIIIIKCHTEMFYFVTLKFEHKWFESVLSKPKEKNVYICLICIQVCPELHAAYRSQKSRADILPLAIDVGGFKIFR